MFTLTVGLFEEFYFGQDAIVVSSNAEGIEHLAWLLREVVASRIPRSLAEGRDVVAKSGETILLLPTNACLGMKRSPPSTLSFIWRISDQTANGFAAALKALAVSPRAGHQYLDTHPGDDVVVIASKDEYPANMFQ